MQAAAAAGAIAVGSVWGTLARLGLVALTTYDAQSVTPMLWAQAVGCFVMGWATYPANHEVLQSTPVLAMITTGFCGCCTTYSTWIVSVFQAVSNYSHHQRTGLDQLVDALGQTGATLMVALASFWSGRAFAEAVNLAELDGSQPAKLVKRWRKRAPITLVCVGLGIATWGGAAVLCGTYAPFRQVTFAVVLAPPGALLRWYLARYNAPIPAGGMAWRDWRAWPLGTMMANLAAVAILCTAECIQYVGRQPRPYTRNVCWALYGVQQGFCSGLSTLSTVAVELDKMRPRRVAVAYLAATWAFGLVLTVLLLGIPWWVLGQHGACAAVG